MTIPINSINKQEAETKTKLNTLQKENERLRDYNTQLKLGIIGFDGSAIEVFSLKFKKRANEIIEKLIGIIFLKMLL